MTFIETVKKYLPNSIICDHCGLPQPKQSTRYCETCKEYYCPDCRARHYGHLTLVKKWEFECKP